MQAEPTSTEIAMDNKVSYHPLFASPDADIVLSCKDGSQHFRVHSFSLKTTSGWFRTMFTLPQTGASSSACSDVIYLDEDADTVEALLRMTCGLAIPPLSSYDSIEPLLYAADKYDMPGPLSIIRMVLMTPAVACDPLRLYAVACRYGWEHEAKYASQQSLALNLRDPDLRPALQKLGTDAILNLFDLHHRRRDELRRMLDDPPFVNANDPHIVCSMCDHNVDYHTWRELKYAISAEMDLRPLADTILNVGLTEWPAAKACWTAKCVNSDCARLLYDKSETLRLIRECVEQLPSTI